MDIDRLIVEFPNAVSDELCSHVIEYHEELESQGETHKGTFGYTDKFDNKIKDDTESVFDNCEKYASDVELLADTLHNLIEKYYNCFILKLNWKKFETEKLSNLKLMLMMRILIHYWE